MVEYSKEATIDSFEIIKPKFVITGRNLWRVEIWLVPAGDNVTEANYQLIGEAKLESLEGNKQTWVFVIPEEPLSAEEIFAKGFDWHGQFVSQRLLPFVGSSNLYNALWLESATRLVALKVGQETRVENVRIKLTKVVEDSRCPIDVMCENRGVLLAEFEFIYDSEVEIAVLSSGQRDFYFDSYSVKLTKVSPPKKAGQPIEPGQYSITIYLFKLAAVP